MKILNKKEFYKLPIGTVYSKYDPVCFDLLYIKGENLYGGENGEPSDFFYIELISNVSCYNSNEFVDILEEAEEKGTSFDLDFESQTRDGMYDDSQLFAVYEKKDLEGLISKLQSSLFDCEYYR